MEAEKLEKIKFNRISREYSDCTSDYDVVLEKEMTVIDFVKAVIDLSDKKWGSVAVCEGKIPPYAFPYGTVVFEFIYRGAGIRDNIPRETVILELKKSGFANDLVKQVRSNGGYGDMDYWVLI